MSSKEEAPLIGDNFSGPKNNGPRTEPLQRKEPPKDKEEKKEAKSEEFKKTTDGTPKPLTAAEKAKVYQDTLKALDIPIEKAREIMDDVIFKDCYIHDVRIGKLKIGLRTRVYQDLQRLMRMLETVGPSFGVHTDDIVARYNVAASLDFYGDTKFSFPKVGTAKPDEVEKAFEERLGYLQGRPIALINRLITETQKFDLMIAAVFAEGAPEDF